MNPEGLLISQASVHLDGHAIFQNVTASIAAGEFIGIFGPNGSGKTTLMRALLGLMPLSVGKISIFGKAAGKANHLIGYMPQAVTIPETMALSARALMMAVQEGHGWGIPWNNKKRAEEVDAVLALTDMQENAGTPFNRLSGGEKQRILLAQALLGNPRLLLLDEPLASLDPGHQAKLVQCIDNIKKTTGAIILFVAHDMNPLLQVMDRVFYMAGGSAVIGPVEEVISSHVLSALYNTTMHVVRAEGHVFIVNAENNTLETRTCCHA